MVKSASCPCTKAYNVKLKKKDTMVIKKVIKFKTKTGMVRYRLAGVGTDGTKMSKFVTEAAAKNYAKSIGLTYKK